MQTQSAGDHTLHPTAPDASIQRANGELARQREQLEQRNSAVALIKTPNDGAHLFLWEPIKERGEIQGSRRNHPPFVSFRGKGEDPNGRPPRSKRSPEEPCSICEGKDA